jgi:N-methylhydantoinase B
METTSAGTANTAGEGARHPSFGALGGQDGKPHHYRLLSGDSTRTLKTKEVGIPVLPGDIFFIHSAGGGGYGPPSERLESARDSDITNGFVSESSSASSLTSKEPD